MKRLTIAALSALVLALLLSGCQQKSKGTADTGQPPSGSVAGSQAPGEAPSPEPPAAPAGAWTGNAKDFSYRDPSGKVRKLSEHAGKPIVVDFWAVW